FQIDAASGRDHRDADGGVIGGVFGDDVVRAIAVARVAQREGVAFATVDMGDRRLAAHGHERGHIAIDGVVRSLILRAGLFSVGVELDGVAAVGDAGEGVAAAAGRVRFHIVVLVEPEKHALVGHARLSRVLDAVEVGVVPDAATDRAFADVADIDGKGGLGRIQPAVVGLGLDRVVTAARFVVEVRAIGDDDPVVEVEGEAAAGGVAQDVGHAAAGGGGRVAQRDADQGAARGVLVDGVAASVNVLGHAGGQVVDVDGEGLAGGIRAVIGVNLNDVAATAGFVVDA